jgi:hypothetical protein
MIGVVRVQPFAKRSSGSKRHGGLISHF